MPQSQIQCECDSLCGVALFNFQLPRGDFCTVALGGAKVMLVRPQKRMEGTSVTSSKRPVEIYLEVSDVDAYHDQLQKKAIKVISPLTDQWWGDRTFTVMDPFGYQIWFYQTVGEPKPPKGAKII
jgi:PhnB protein